MSYAAPPLTSDVWSDANIETLKRLWSLGMSGGQIAAKIPGATRSAVIGKVHRLRLKGEIAQRDLPSQPTRLKAERPPRQRQVKAPPRIALRTRPPKALPAPPVIDYSHAKPWTERKFGECAFPIGEGADALSCCAPTERTYCVACEAVMYRAEQPTMRSTMRIGRLAA